jgi:hypothetical protein
MYTELDYEGEIFPKFETFNTPYSQYKEHQGKEFNILQFCGIQENAPMFIIEVETGEKFVALPEEIFKGFGG